ncbi:MAG TPA: hypothetical protein VIV60_05845 [Polyangiaceae bacterium]
MTRSPFDNVVSEFEPFLAAERELVAEPEDLRNRVMERAWASLQDNAPLYRIQRESKPRRVTIGLAAAAAVMLTAMCAVAFIAGYGVKSRNPDVGGKLPAAEASVTRQQVPASSIVVALVPVPSRNMLPRNSAPTSAVPHADKVGPGGSARTTIDIEAYTKELRLLQPARQAVARGDFGSALVTIADHQSQFPSGKLTEEREALRVKALLGLGRTADAQRAGAAFRAHFPHSALLKRLDEMLGTQK